MRLIDADKLSEWFSKHFAESDKVDNREIHEVIDNAPSVDAVSATYIKQMYDALRSAYKNEREIFAKYNITDKHTELERMAFNFCIENMQNLDCVLGTLEEIMEEIVERKQYEAD